MLGRPIYHAYACWMQYFYFCQKYFDSDIGVGWIRGKDSSRVLHYEGGGSRTSSTDIICPMYMRVWDIVNIANDPNETRPLILCE